MSKLTWTRRRKMRVLVKVRRHRWCSHQAVHDGQTRNSWMADTRKSEADYIEAPKAKKRNMQGKWTRKKKGRKKGA